jgi:RES domain-containing protein
MLAPHLRFHAFKQAIESELSGAASWSGTVYRSTGLRYTRVGDILSGLGSRKNGGRWNPPESFSAIYASLTPELAMAEAFAHYRYYSIPVSNAMPRVFVAIDVRLERVLDLTSMKVCGMLGLGMDDLIQQDWRHEQRAGREALTQALGRAAFHCSLEGLLIPSAARPGGSNLAVFPTNLLSSSSISVSNSSLLPGD